MTNIGLAKSYLVKAEKRLKILPVLYQENDYSDVIRESQEIVELSLKGLLRNAGIEPPKHHDVGPLLEEHRERFPHIADNDIRTLARISKELRKERELSFYGDIDFIPTESYTINDAEKAMEDAQFVVMLVKREIERSDYAAPKGFKLD